MSQIRLNVEALEARDTPSSADLTGGVLTVIGTSAANDINVTLSSGKIRVTDGGSLVGQYSSSAVSKIVVDAGMGNDRVTISTAIKLTTFIYGGKGNDILTGGNGKDNLYGGDGVDTLNGRGGKDKLWGGASVDTLLDTSGLDKTNQGSPNRTYQMNAAELDVVARVNQERAGAGLAPLAVNSRLAFAAQFHAGQMARRDEMQHTLYGVNAPTPSSRLDYAGYDAWWAYGENVAFGYTSSAAVMQGWMNSAGHRANILGSDFTEIGVGVVAASDGTLYWCQVFGRS